MQQFIDRFGDIQLEEISNTASRWGRYSGSKLSGFIHGRRQYMEQEPDGRAFRDVGAASSISTAFIKSSLSTRVPVCVSLKYFLIASTMRTHPAQTTGAWQPVVLCAEPVPRSVRGQFQLGINYRSGRRRALRSALCRHLIYSAASCTVTSPLLQAEFADARTAGLLR